MGNCDSSINDYGETERVRFNQTAANIVKEVSNFAIHNQMEKVMFGIESLHERAMLYNNLNSLASASASPHSELLGLHSHKERRNKDVMTRIGGPTVFIACHNFFLRDVLLRKCLTEFTEQLKHLLISNRDSMYAASRHNDNFIYQEHKYTDSIKSILDICWLSLDSFQQTSSGPSLTPEERRSFTNKAENIFLGGDGDGDDSVVVKAILEVFTLDEKKLDSAALHRELVDGRYRPVPPSRKVVQCIQSASIVLERLACMFREKFFHVLLRLKRTTMPNLLKNFSQGIAAVGTSSSFQGIGYFVSLIEKCLLPSRAGVVGSVTAAAANDAAMSSLFVRDMSLIDQLITSASLWSTADEGRSSLFSIFRLLFHLMVRNHQNVEVRNAIVEHSRFNEAIDKAFQAFFDDAYYHEVASISIRRDHRADHRPNPVAKSFLPVLHFILCLMTTNIVAAASEAPVELRRRQQAVVEATESPASASISDQLKETALKARMRLTNERFSHRLLTALSSSVNDDAVTGALCCIIWHLVNEDEVTLESILPVPPSHSRQQTIRCCAADARRFFIPSTLLLIKVNGVNKTLEELIADAFITACLKTGSNNTAFFLASSLLNICYRNRAAAGQFATLRSLHVRNGVRDYLSGSNSNGSYLKTEVDVLNDDRGIFGFQPESKDALALLSRVLEYSHRHNALPMSETYNFDSEFAAYLKNLQIGAIREAKERRSHLSKNKNNNHHHHHHHLEEEEDGEPFSMMAVVHQYSAASFADTEIIELPAQVPFGFSGGGNDDDKNNSTGRKTNRNRNREPMF